MTKQGESVNQIIVAKYPCPKPKGCGAHVGRPCITKSGQDAITPHVYRRNLYYADQAAYPETAAVMLSSPPARLKVGKAAVGQRAEEGEHGKDITVTVKLDKLRSIAREEYADTGGTPPGFVVAEHNLRVQRAKEALYLARYILDGDDASFIQHLAELFVKADWDLKMYGRETYDRKPE